MLEVMAPSGWALALRGLAAILLGVLAFAWPGLTLVALTFLFGGYALVGGLFALIAAARGRTGELTWWACSTRACSGSWRGPLRSPGRD
jgi:uncharacterized membrane protein HdeD (DUF308 family)